MKRHIPNFLTCCNLISGCLSVYFALSGSLGMAFFFIIIGGIFDFFDGFVARLLHVSSPIGKELDSLADLITFGFAPATMLYYEFLVLDLHPVIFAPYQKYVAFLPLILVAFSALRLAKFNLDERQSTSFVGLPTPANALFWASILTGPSITVIENFRYSIFLLLIGVFISSYLLVSEIPMFALKFKTWDFRSNRLKYSFIALSTILFFIFNISGLGIIIVIYILLSVYNNIVKARDL